MQARQHHKEGNNAREVIVIALSSLTRRAIIVILIVIKGLTICTPNEFVPSMFWDAFLSMPYVLFFGRSIFVVWCPNFFHTIFTYSYIPGPKEK